MSEISTDRQAQKLIEQTVQFNMGNASEAQGSGPAIRQLNPGRWMRSL